MWFKTATSSIFSSTFSKIALVAIAASLTACGGDKKPAPVEPVAECTDAPGMVHVFVSTTDGKQLCNAETTVTWADGKTSAMKLQPKMMDGKSTCGFSTDKAGKVAIKANGFNPGAASWTAPAVCENRNLSIKLAKM